MLSYRRQLGPVSCVVAHGSGLVVRRWSGAVSLPIEGARTAHDGVEITFFDAGAAAYRGERDAARGLPGRVVVVPSGTPHVTAFIPCRALRCTTLELAPALLDRAGPWTEGRLGELACSASAAHLLRAIDAEIASTSPCREVVDAAALALVASLGERARQSPRPHRLRSRGIREAVAHMQAHLAEPLTLEALANVAGMSRFHFSRRFKEEVGRAPYDHFLELRIGRAEMLLRREGASVTRVGLDVGFRDVGTFTRAFRRHRGMTPSAVRSRP